MSDNFKMCLDKVAPPELEEQAKHLAYNENPNNSPPLSPFEMALDWRYLWRPGSTLNVRFLGGDPRVQAKVEQYAHQWEEFANIKFNFVRSGKAHIRIAFMEGDGSWSYLGTQALLYSDPQIPTMNYGWLTPESDEQEYTRVVLHEFGHALGCIHEHQHPQHGIPWNKEKAYAYYGQRGWTKEEVDYQVFRSYSTSITQFSRFDPDSIMIYPIPADITDGTFSVGWNRQLSETDKLFIGQSYPFS